MADFQSEIPEEYLDSDFDFGFTAVDADELEQITSETTDAPATSGTISSDRIIDYISELESKINAVLLKLDNESDDSFSPAIEIDMSRVEEKLDKILAMENNELMSAVSDQSESIRAVIDEVEERKAQLNEQYTVRMREVEKLIMPLLIHLKKNPSKEYIYWPNRTAKIDEQIKRILAYTRGA
tara:strand:- start:1070 stop:1618 length:549 start_codon:yes stop_codon:yes gene_type:complete